jgi:hypothetical protein
MQLRHACTYAMHPADVCTATSKCPSTHTDKQSVHVGKHPGSGVLPNINKTVSLGSPCIPPDGYALPRKSPGPDTYPHRCLPGLHTGLHPRSALSALAPEINICRPSLRHYHDVGKYTGSGMLPKINTIPPSADVLLVLRTYSVTRARSLS